MRPLLHRLVFAGATGYIFMYFSELLFWARPLPGTTLPAVIPLWLIYMLAAFVFLSLVSRWHIHTLTRVVLAGALYGWLTEGVFAQTLYGMLPFSISFTGLSWHALLTIGLGWWFLPRVLSAATVGRSMLLAGLIGAGYGVWAIGWWTEASPAAVGAFALYSLTATLGLIIAYWVLLRWPLATFAPSRGEYIISGGIVVAFLVVVALTQQLVAVLVLVPLVLLTLLVLARNRNADPARRVMTELALPHPLSQVNLFTLVLIPAIATGIYALAETMHVIWPINIFWYLITMPLGFICFLLAAFRSLRETKKLPAANTMSPPHTT